MTELQENSSQLQWKLVVEECDASKIDKVDLIVNKLPGIILSAEVTKSTVDETACPKSTERGDGPETPVLVYSPFNVSNVGVASLCSVDKMRIDHLVSELNKCVAAKKETEMLIKVSKSEKEDMVKKFESCESYRHETDRINLESELSTETMELNKLTANTSYSLKILADQISAWEHETSLITDTVNELLAQKIRLENEIIRMGIKTMLLTGEETRIGDRVAMEKLYLKKYQLKADTTVTLTFDRGCQTEEKALP